MRVTFIVDLDVLLFDLVKAFLEHWIRWISYEAAIALLRLLLIVDVAISSSLNGSLVVWIDIVTCHSWFSISVASKLHPVDL